MKVGMVGRVVILFLFFCFCSNKEIYRPVVLMHGLMAGNEAMSHAQAWIEADFPGIYILNVEIGNGKWDSLTMEINSQVDKLAAAIRADPNLKKGFNLIGHSQGGLLTRAYVERYNDPPVYNLLGWVPPNDGVYGVPEFNVLCPDEYCPWLDDLMDLVMDGYWIDTWFQSHVSFATYWKDPYNIAGYLGYNTFLADLNNERPQKNATYKANIMSLNSYLILYSTIDEIVVPTLSPWFYFYKDYSETEIVELRNSTQYLEDWLGLRTLDQAGKLILHSVDCYHQDVPRDTCKQWYDLYSKQLLNNTIQID